jgi:hypothetical protein
MGIYDFGTEFPWEIWVGLAIAAIVLYLAIRTSKRADRRHMHASGTATRTTGASSTNRRTTTGVR